MTHTAKQMLAMMRDAGWRVVSHNDYDLKETGVFMTFWGFVLPSRGRFVKGEASTDEQAIRQAWEQVFPL